MGGTRGGGVGVVPEGVVCGWYQRGWYVGGTIGGGVWAVLEGCVCGRY